MCEICDGKSYEQVRREMFARIAEHDYTKVSVRGEEEGDVIHPGFTYSVGLWAVHSAPELIVVGARGHAYEVVDAYARRVISGERFRSGRIYRSFFGGVPALLQEVDRNLYEEWLCSAFQLYPDGDFPVLQLVWPSCYGSWPWEPGWDHCEPQPVLTATGMPDVDPLRLRRAG